MNNQDWNAHAVAALVEWAGPEFAATGRFNLLQAKLVEVASFWRKHDWDADIDRINDRAGWRANRERIGKTFDRLFVQMAEFEYPEVEVAMVAYLIENLPPNAAKALKAVNPELFLNHIRDSLIAARNLASSTRGKHPTVTSRHHIWDRLGFRDGEWWGPLIIKRIQPNNLPARHIAVGVALADVVARFGPYASRFIDGNPSRPAKIERDTPWTVLSHFTLPDEDGLPPDPATLSRLVRHQHRKPLYIRDPS
ncbi:hypothetical protein Sphch_3152 [Sphingobium chlorophenolicum L-1]|uniref:Uncharacterized protein n=1 Tax=Sphingobium chlorophenolicum L-1 TaxID=690566 RepID=F6F2V5_SPHCR|nr:hypothetical protein [Sphingobium chlorophenolicum]AEG50767.1 hypothetical protein Sphch_3152 [Sphingobium chlorophenolicum L-1]